MDQSLLALFALDLHWALRSQPQQRCVIHSLHLRGLAACQLRLYASLQLALCMTCAPPELEP